MMILIKQKSYENVATFAVNYSYSLLAQVTSSRILNACYSQNSSGSSRGPVCAFVYICICVLNYVRREHPHGTLQKETVFFNIGIAIFMSLSNIISGVDIYTFVPWLKLKF